VNAELRRAPDRSTRRIFFECAAVAVVVLFAYAASRPSAVATLGRLYDDVVYLSVGKSIADGHGYRSAQLVGTPVHAKFPPLLPAIYAVGWLAFGTLGVVAAMALWLNIVVASASAGVLWWLARRELGVSPVLAAPFVALPVVTDRTMFYFSGAASEPWMLLGWAVALVLARRLTRMVEPRTSATGTCVALGLTLAATALSRTQGAVIAIAVIAGLALSSVGLRRWLVVATTAAAPLAGWAVWHGAMMARGPLSQLPDQTSYLAWIPMRGVTDFARFAAAMTKLSVPLYWSNAADVLAGWTSPKTLALAATIVLVGLVGTALLARRFPEMSLSLLFTLGVLAIWPYVQDRFLTPVLPMLGVAGAFAAQRAIALVPTPVRRGSLAAAAVVTAMPVDRERTSPRGERSRPGELTVRAGDLADGRLDRPKHRARRSHHGLVGRRHLPPHRPSHVDPESRGARARAERSRRAAPVPRDAAAGRFGRRRDHLGPGAGTGGSVVACARGGVSGRADRSVPGFVECGCAERRAVLPGAPRPAMPARARTQGPRAEQHGKQERPDCGAFFIATGA
jgi:hypothetical protein